MRGSTVTVERLIGAPPGQIFALLSDAGRHQSFDGSGTVQGTKKSERPLQRGSRFGMSMKMGAGYRTANTVIEYEQDRRIAWQTTGFGGLVGGRIWRYELEPSGDGTLVRETWDISQDKQRFLLKRSNFPAKTKNDMTRTLARIADAVDE